MKGLCKATWKKELKLPWREAGPPDHLNDEVDSDQYVVNQEVSLFTQLKVKGAGSEFHYAERSLLVISK